LGGGDIAGGGGASMVFFVVIEGTYGLWLKDGNDTVWVILLGFVSDDAGLLLLMASKGMGATTDGSCEFVFAAWIAKV
jgi:hypothetical protein